MRSKACRGGVVACSHETIRGVGRHDGDELAFVRDIERIQT